MMRTREKITFTRNVLTPDGSGGNTVVEQEIWTPIYAYVTEVSISDDILATQKGLNSLMQVECRYNPEISILAGDMIKWRGFTLIALKPMVQRIERLMTIRAYSEIETTDRGLNNQLSNTLQPTLQFTI
jgi:hypothetical protein